jgi:hypothetical protein
MSSRWPASTILRVTSTSSGEVDRLRVVARRSRSAVLSQGKSGTLSNADQVRASRCTPWGSRGVVLGTEQHQAQLLLFQQAHLGHQEPSVTGSAPGADALAGLLTCAPLPAPP